MGNLVSYVSLSKIEFSFSSLDRYKNIDEHYTSMVSFSNCRFIKKDIISLNINFDTAKTLNFGYYQNFENGKKFYFFITDYEYISDSVTNIYIKHDFFSTYSQEFFSTVCSSYVERIHSLDDSYPRTNEYNPILPTIDIFLNSKELSWGNDCIVAINRYIPQNTDISNYPSLEMYFTEFKSVGIGKHGGDISYRYLLTTIENAKILVKNATAWGYQDSILGIYAIPHQLVVASASSIETVNFDSIKKLELKNFFQGEKTSISVPNENWRFLNFTNGMIPLFSEKFSIEKSQVSSIYNATYKKCYDSQYISVVLKLVDNVNQYDYTLFSDDILFNIFCTLNENATLYIVPYNFDGNVGNNWECGTISVGLVGKTLINVDNTQQSLNNSNIQLSKNLLSGFLDTAHETSLKISNSSISTIQDIFSSSNLINPIFSLTKNGLNSIESYNDNRKSFTKFSGISNTNIYQFPDTVIKLGFRCLQTDDFKRLDKFFSCYGYLYNTIMIPKFRNSYTFLKGDINFSAPIPNNAKNEIKELFANGLTIWDKTPIFNYDVI